ncbi:MAG: TM1802 family CRISPR-associated protein [Promethearchaeota archaeon]
MFFNKQKMNVSNKNPEYRLNNLIQKSLMMDLCLEFLEGINSLYIKDLKKYNMEINMVDNKILEEFEEYWKGKSVYNHPHAKALFLLGYLIGEIKNCTLMQGSMMLLEVYMIPIFRKE